MIELDLKNVNAAAMVLRAIRNPLRQKMIALIDENPGISVTELFIRLRIEQAVASQHLSILRQSSLVRTEREGKLIHYYINYDTVKGISELANQLCMYFKK